MPLARPRHLASRLAALAAVGAVCVWAASVDAGVAADRGGVHVGPTRLTGEGVQVGTRRLAGCDVRLAVIDTTARTLPQPNVVRWRDGQVWPCEIVALTAGKLTLRSPWFGAKTVPAAGLAGRGRVQRGMVADLGHLLGRDNLH